ncbi:MAG: hypothetical protein R2838_23695 [Caldilineaceae bacterium]
MVSLVTPTSVANWRTVGRARARRQAAVADAVLDLFGNLAVEGPRRLAIQRQVWRLGQLQ